MIYWILDDPFISVQYHTYTSELFTQTPKLGTSKSHSCDSFSLFLKRCQELCIALIRRKELRHTTSIPNYNLFRLFQIHAPSYGRKPYPLQCIFVSLGMVQACGEQAESAGVTKKPDLENFAQAHVGVRKCQFKNGLGSLCLKIAVRR